MLINSGESNETFQMDEKKVKISIKNQAEKQAEYFYLVSKNMGTTANVLFINDGYLYCANAGDCLCVAYAGGKAIPLNIEHKVSLPSEKKRILSSGSKIINNRINGKLNLSRAIGKN